MRVAITTDWLTTFGGAERVLVELHKMYPAAPIFTSLHNPAKLPEEMQGWDVRTSFLQRLPFARERYQALLPLMPLAFESFDFRDFDVVITTNHACAKGILTRPGTLNLCYCYTPCRYIWDLYQDYTEAHSLRPLIAPIAHWLRMWDRLAADRVDHFVAISQEVAGRIWKHYRRESEVIYPPVSVDRFHPTGKPPEDFYLVVSRLVPYKRVDLAIEACNRLGRRLVIVGDGSERARLESMAGPTVTFLGRRPDAEIASLYARCRALLFPGHEDFGIAPVEAQAAGRPVIAYAKGGALETVVDATTGVFFEQQTAEAIAEAALRLDRLNIDPSMCRQNANRFAVAEFVRRMSASIAGLTPDRRHAVNLKAVSDASRAG